MSVYGINRFTILNPSNVKPIKESKTSDYMTTGAYKVPNWILSLAKAFLSTKYVNNERVREHIDTTIASYAEKDANIDVKIPFSFSDKIKIDGPIGEFDFHPLDDIKNKNLREELVPVISKLKDYIKTGLNQGDKESNSSFSVSIKPDDDKIKDIIHIEMNKDITH